MSKLQKLRELLNTPLSQLFKKTSEPLEWPDEEIDHNEDGFWEARNENYDSGKHIKDVRTWNEENAFFRTPADFNHIDESGGPVPVMDDGIKGTLNAFSIGSNRAGDIQLNWYVRHGFIGYQTCAIIKQHWLVNRACSIPGQDAIRNGYRITSNTDKLKPEVIQDILDLDEQFAVNRQMREFSRMCRVFGIRIVLYCVKSKDKKYYTKPFNIDGVTEGSYQGMVQVDPYWITPELDGDAASNPASPDFYEPTFWRISGQLYHKSHLVITRYAEVADVLKPNYIYGGIPLTQMIYERVYAAERTANEAPQLALSKRLFVIKTNTVKALANLAAFGERLNIFARFKNNHGVQAIDKQEEFDQHDTALNGFNEMMDGQYNIVSAISEVPVTKLMSRQHTGLQSNGSGERRNYEDVLQNEQERNDPLLNRHHKLLIKSHIEPKRGPQPRISHVWNPVTAPTAAELAEINDKKADTAKKYWEMEAIDSVEVRTSVITDPNSGFSLDTDNSSEDVDYTDYDDDVKPKDRTIPSPQDIAP